MKLSLLNRFQGALQGACLTAQPDTRPAIAALIPHLSFSKSLSLTDWQDWTTPEHIGVALIPLMLFYHDCPAAFYQQLRLLQRNQWLNPSETEAITLIFQIMSLILRERFDPRQDLGSNLARLSEFWQFDFDNGEASGLTAIVAKISTAIAAHLSLHQVRQLFSPPSEQEALGLALYCWLDSPDHFSLSWQRAKVTQNPRAIILTGTLSGVYNGSIGMPANKSLTFESQPTKTLLGQLSQALYYRWSGGQSPALNRPQPVTTAPLVMQRRPSLKLISQCEYP
ncbi:MAG: hypothetical protein VKL42_17990 [Snowella sp.]|nr:hypothetical protein [Snowella sp.]